MTEEELKKIEKENGTKDDFVFMREEIKARPINRKKLARNTIVAAISAVVFGIVACVTFALIAPFVMEKFSERDDAKTEEALTPISFPEGGRLLLGLDPLPVLAFLDKGEAAEVGAFPPPTTSWSSTSITTESPLLASFLFNLLKETPPGLLDM